MKKSLKNILGKNNDEAEVTDSVSELSAMAATADSGTPDQVDKLQVARDRAAQYMRDGQYDKARRVLREAENLQAQEVKAPEVVEVDYATRLAAAQEKVMLCVREQRFEDARQAIKEVEALQAEETNVQRLAEAKAEREKALLLTNEGKYTEAEQALKHADELEALVAGWKGRPGRLLTSVRSRLPEFRKKGDKAADAQPEIAEMEAVEPVVEASRIVSQHAKIAVAAGLLPGGLLNFAGVLAVQVPMVWRIARQFDQQVTKSQVRGVILSLFGSVIPAAIGQSAGTAIAAIPAALAGAVVYFVATPVLAYALTKAVGNVFIMHFESGGTLLTFDPKAFTEYFVTEFKKAGGALRQEAEPVPAV